MSATAEQLQEQIRHLEQERDDARAVANWLKGLLWDVDRLNRAVESDDIPKRSWLSFDNEPESCP